MARKFLVPVILASTGGSKDQLTIPDTSVGAGLTVGGDTNLYRSAANTWKTDDGLWVLGQDGGGIASFGTNAIAPGNSPPGAIYIREDGSGAIVLIERYESDAGPNITFRHARDGGADVVSGDLLARMDFWGRNQNSFDYPQALGAMIDFTVDATPGTTYLPGRIQFYTSAASGSSGVLERLRIDSAGKVWFGVSEGLDTNLYRSFGDTLKTDDVLHADGGLQSNYHWGGAGNYGPYIDLNLNTGVFVINRTTTSNIPLIVRGMAAQTGDLQQWQSSTPTILTAIDKDGKLVFGPSGSQDTNLYRSAANVLKSDDAFHAVGGLASGNLTPAANEIYAAADIVSYLNGERVRLGQGAITFGAAENVNIYRSADNVLATDDEFLIGINGGKDTLALTNTTANVGITIGGDTNLYRSAANTLKTDDAFAVEGILYADSELFVASATTLDGALYLGSEQDTNLQRAGAGQLLTNSVLFIQGGGIILQNDNPSITMRDIASGNIANTTYATRVGTDTIDRFNIWGNGTMNWGPGSSTAMDTNLYRSAADTLKTDDSLVVGTNFNDQNATMVAATSAVSAWQAYA